MAARRHWRRFRVHRQRRQPDPERAGEVLVGIFTARNTAVGTPTGMTQRYNTSFNVSAAMTHAVAGFDAPATPGSRPRKPRR